MIVLAEDLELTQQWQRDRLHNNEDPTDGAAYQAWLGAIGKDATNPRKYGAIAVAGTPVTAPAAYAPEVTQHRPPLAAIQGAYAQPPRGVLLHGSRSGRPHGAVAEFEGTAGYCARGAFIPDPSGGYYLAWTATIGPDRVGVHLDADTWGWNAGVDSRTYLAVEFAQPTVLSPITNNQVNAFCWWFQHIARVRWPDLPKAFPMHSETEQGRNAGKSDVFPAGSSQGLDLLVRIRARLAAMGVT